MTDSDAAASRPSRSRLRRLVTPLLLGLVLPAGLIGLALTAWGVDAYRVGARLQTARPGLALWRLGWVAVLILAWGPLSAWLGRWRELTPAQVAVLQSQRWALAILLLAAEWVLVQNVLGRLLALL